MRFNYINTVVELEQDDDHSGLVEMLRQGDKEAFQEIYRKFWNRLFRLACTKVKGTDNAKEIVQDIFLDLWHRRAQVNIVNLERYLLTAVKYKVFDYFKKEALHKQYTSTYILHQTESEDVTEDEVAYNDLYQYMLETVNYLPEKTKAIFELNRFQNKTAEEISLLLSIPQRTVEYHITQALKILRIRLSDYLTTIILLIIFHKL